MNFQTKISYSVEKTWNDFLLTNKNSTAYQHSDFFYPYKLAFNSKPVYITILNSTGEIVGQLSAIIHLTEYWLESNIISKLIDSKLNLGCILNWFYGPIIHDLENYNEILSNILSAIDKIAIDNNVNLISSSFPPNQSTLPTHILKKNNYVIKRWTTYITDVSRSSNQIYDDLDKKTRYDIRQGEKAKLEFEVISKKESYRHYIDIKYKDKKKAEKIKNVNKYFARHVWDTTYKTGLENSFLVRFEGRPLAALNTALYNGNVVQLGVANSPKINRYGGTFLTWNVIRWLSENNYRTFDVGGANPNPKSKKEQDIDFFKSKWNGQRYDYVLCTKVFNRTKQNISKIIKQPNAITSKINKIFSRSI